MNPYSSYKDSGVEWIGEIPSHWDKIKVKFISKVFGGSTPKSSVEDYWGGEIKWITPTDIGKVKEEKFLQSTERNITEKGLNSSGCSIIPKGSVVVTNRGPIGNVIIPTFDFTTNQGCKSIICDESFSSDFSYYLLKVSQNVLESLGKGTTFMELSTTSLKNYEIPHPTHQEQTQIVSFLDTKTQKIDELIEKTEQKIELLKEKRTSLINHCVTKGLNPNVEMKDSGVEWIGEIPRKWNLISLKHLVSTKITDGPHETPEFVDEGIPFLSVESVQDNKLNFNRKRGFITEETHKEYSKKCKPQRDDVFLVKSGSTTGKSTIVETDEEFNIWSPLCLIRSDKSKVTPRFTFTSLQSFYFRRFVELGWSFGTQPNIGMGVIENIRIIVPPLSEQTQIVKYLDEQTQKIDSTVEKESQRIELLKEYRQSLISEVVTGKVDVRGWNGN